MDKDYISVKVLDLRQNDISSVNNTVLISYPNLKIIDLRQNPDMWKNPDHRCRGGLPNYANIQCCIVLNVVLVLCAVYLHTRPHYQQHFTKTQYLY